MKIIKHRVNTIDELQTLDRKFGAEIDVRYHQNDLILHHDPFQHHLEPQPQRLDSFLEQYDLTGPLILNIKTEGIEQQCIELMKRHHIKQWFFLDLSMPYFVRYAVSAAAGNIESFGPDNLATRFSEYEAIEYCMSFKNKAQWLWVDYFTHYPISETLYKQLSFFNICLVSPELQGHSTDKIATLKKQINSQNITAVCTKHPEFWQS